MRTATRFQPGHRQHQHQLAGDEDEHRGDVHAADRGNRLLEGLEEGARQGLEEGRHGVVGVHPREQRLQEHGPHDDVDREPEELHECQEHEHRDGRAVHQLHALQQREDRQQHHLRPPGHGQRGQVELEEAGYHAAQRLHREIGERHRELRQRVPRRRAQHLHPEAHERGQDEEIEDRLDDEGNGLGEHDFSPARTVRPARGSGRRRPSRHRRSAP